MAVDFIPRSDLAALVWARQFADYGAAHVAELNLPPGAFDAIVAAVDELVAAHADHVAIRDAARAGRARKDAARVAMAVLARGMNHRLQADPAVDGAQKILLGLTDPDPLRSPAAAPRSVPQALVEQAGRRTHRLVIADRLGGALRRRRPRGTLGAEIWGALGDPDAPPDPADFALLRVAPRSGVLIEHPAAAAGRTAWYALRWLSTRAQTGPWGDLAGATVTA